MGEEPLIAAWRRVYVDAKFEGEAPPYGLVAVVGRGGVDVLVLARWWCWQVRGPGGA